MLKIRLKPVGKKRDISSRIIVTEAGKGISSNNYIEQIGFYDPRIDRKDIDVEAAKKWLSNGAQPSDTVYNLLIDAGAIEGRKKNVLPQKSAPVVEGSEDASDSTEEVAAPDTSSADGDQSAAEEVIKEAATEAPENAETEEEAK